MVTIQKPWSFGDGLCWFMLVGLMAVACSTLWRRGESSLPPYSLLLIMEERTRVSSHDFESGHFESPFINVVALLNPTRLSETV